MRKLKLRVEELTVDSYDTTPEGKALRGTVHGRDAFDSDGPTSCTRLRTCTLWITCEGNCYHEG